MKQPLPNDSDGELAPDASLRASWLAWQTVLRTSLSEKRGPHKPLPAPTIKPDQMSLQHPSSFPIWALSLDESSSIYPVPSEPKVRECPSQREPVEYISSSLPPMQPRGSVFQMRCETSSPYDPLRPTRKSDDATRLQYRCQLGYHDTLRRVHGNKTTKVTREAEDDLEEDDKETWNVKYKNVGDALRPESSRSRSGCRKNYNSPFTASKIFSYQYPSLNFQAESSSARHFTLRRPTIPFAIGTSSRSIQISASDTAFRPPPFRPAPLAAERHRGQMSGSGALMMASIRQVQREEAERMRRLSEPPVRGAFTSGRRTVAADKRMWVNEDEIEGVPQYLVDLVDQRKVEAAISSLKRSVQLDERVIEGVKAPVETRKRTRMGKVRRVWNWLERRWVRQ